MRSMRTVALLISLSLLAAACGGKPQAGKGAEGDGASELSPALAPLAWWLGDWEAENGTKEHWVAAAGAIYGISFQDGQTFEIMIVDDGDDRGKPEGPLRFISMPGGQRSIELRQRASADQGAGQSALFANDDNDFPKTIRYAREGDALAATFAGDDERKVELRLRRAAAARATNLEELDRAFAADTAKRGAEGWAAAFDPEGWMMRGSGDKIEHDALAEQMRPILTAGKLEWAPIASGIHDTLGYTVGKATFTAKEGGERRLTTYVTIWRKQADGAWKALFDTGRIVQD
jgi:hypothetical protein